MASLQLPLEQQTRFSLDTQFNANKLRNLVRVEAFELEVMGAVSAVSSLSMSRNGRQDLANISPEDIQRLFFNVSSLTIRSGCKGV